MTTEVAKIGFEAMMRGNGGILSSWKHKLRTVPAAVTPAGVLTEPHRKRTQPGFGAH